MRVVVNSLNRSCSSATASLAEQKFGLTNYSEVFAEGNPYKSLPPEHDDNWVMKIMAHVVMQRLFDYRVYDWGNIDKIIFTERSIETQVASWLHVNAVYHALKPLRQNMDTNDITRMYATWCGPVDVSDASFRDIQAQFKQFRDMRDWIAERFPTSTVTYDMFQADVDIAAARLSTALNWDVRPAELLTLHTRKTERDYAAGITNYSELLHQLQRYEIHY